MGAGTLGWQTLKNVIIDALQKRNFLVSTWCVLALCWAQGWERAQDRQGPLEGLTT